MHDPIYKRLFAFPRMVADLLRAAGGPDWIDDVDFGTLEDVSAQYVADDGQHRRGDAVWRVRFTGRWIYLLVLLEFQLREGRSQRRSASRSAARRLMLTPASAASVARERWVSGGREE